jgi:hypothetical protein
MRNRGLRGRGDTNKSKDCLMSDDSPACLPKRMRIAAEKGFSGPAGGYGVRIPEREQGLRYGWFQEYQRD